MGSTQEYGPFCVNCGLPESDHVKFTPFGKKHGLYECVKLQTAEIDALRAALDDMRQQRDVALDCEEHAKKRAAHYKRAESIAREALRLLEHGDHSGANEYDKAVRAFLASANVAKMLKREPTP